MVRSLLNKENATNNILKPEKNNIIKKKE